MAHDTEIIDKYRIIKPLAGSTKKNPISGIYIYWFGERCEDSYIGSTIEFSTRRKYHLNKLRKNKHDCKIFQNAYNKYGEENMSYEEIDTMYFPETYNLRLKRDYLESLENYYQTYFGCRYIILKGGEMCKRTREQLNNSKNHYFSNRKPIYQVDENLNIIKRFEGVRIAERELGVRGAGKVAKLKKSNAKGLLFRYEETLGQKFIPSERIIHSGFSRKDIRKPILCYSLDNIFIREYESITSASNDLNIINSSISRSCTQEQKSAGKFIFRFKTNKND